MGSTIYNIPYLLKLDNKVDLDRLAEAIDSTVEAHPYLKTRLFMDDNGNVLQKRNDGLSYKTPILNGMNRDTLVRPYMLFNEQLFRFECIIAFNACVDHGIYERTLTGVFYGSGSSVRCIQCSCFLSGSTASGVAFSMGPGTSTASRSEFIYSSEIRESSFQGRNAGKNG